MDPERETWESDSGYSVNFINFWISDHQMNSWDFWKFKLVMHFSFAKLIYLRPSKFRQIKFRYRPLDYIPRQRNVVILDISVENCPSRTRSHLGQCHYYPEVTTTPERWPILAYEMHLENIEKNLVPTAMTELSKHSD